MKIRSLIAGAILAVSAGLVGTAPAHAISNDAFNNCFTFTYATTIRDPYQKAVLIRDNYHGDRLLPACQQAKAYFRWSDVDYAYVPSGWYGKFWVPGAVAKHYKGPRWVPLTYSFTNIKLYQASYI